MTPIVRRELGIRRSRHAYRIREALDRRGWTLSALARDIGISVQTVSRVINGQSHSARVLDRLRDENIPERFLFDPRALPMRTERPERTGRIERTEGTGRTGRTGRVGRDSPASGPVPDLYAGPGFTRGTGTDDHMTEIREECGGTILDQLGQVAGNCGGAEG